MHRLKDTKNEYRLQPDYLRQVISAIKDRIRNVHDIIQLCNYYFIEPDYQSSDSTAMKKKVKQPALGT